LIEVHSWTASIAVLDCMEKAANIRLLQIEINDLYGACIKVAGPVSDLAAALDSGRAVAESMAASCVVDLISNPDARAQAAWSAPREFSPLIETDVVHFPHAYKELLMPDQSPFAIGLIETQGLIGVIEAIDTACKAASVEVIGREKLGGGYITVIIKGDVAAVTAAVEAGKAKVDGLGKLIAAHVIPRPTAAVLGLFGKV
jgi:microcompartment protein CcmL/EutN